jgi:hypothetical protein
MVVILCVSECVCYRATTSFGSLKCDIMRILTAFRIVAEKASFKSYGDIRYAGHRCLPHSLTSFPWKKETVLVSFQLEEYAWLAIIMVHC